MKQISSAIEAIRKAFDNHRQRITGIYSDYRKEIDRVSSTYSADIAAQKRSECKRNAQQLLEKADNILNTYVHERADILRSTMQAMSTDVPNGQLLALLQAYQAFGIQLTPVEIRAWLGKTDVNYNDLRFLQSAAKQSGLEMEIPSLAELEQFIGDAERKTLAPTMYAPMEYLKEALELLPNVPVRRDDGSIAYANSRPSSTYLLTVSTDLESVFPKRLETMSVKWANVEAQEIRIDEATVQNDPESVKAVKAVVSEEAKARANAVNIDENAAIERAERLADAEGARRAEIVRRQYFKL